MSSFIYIYNNNQSDVSFIVIFSVLHSYLHGIIECMRSVYVLMKHSSFFSYFLQRLLLCAITAVVCLFSVTEKKLYDKMITSILCTG